MKRCAAFSHLVDDGCNAKMVHDGIDLVDLKKTRCIQVLPVYLSLAALTHQQVLHVQLRADGTIVQRQIDVLKHVGSIADDALA